MSGPVDVYAGGTVARWEVMRRPGQAMIDEVGLRGLLPCAEDPRLRVLVTDDRAHDALAALLPQARAGIVTVFAAARRCAALAGADPAWKAEPGTAMICRALEAVPAVPLPGELTLRPVRRGDEAGSDDVALEAAGALAMQADPRIGDPPDTWVRFLRSLPPEIRLFAGVDGDGAVRATAGSGVFGTQAAVLFVNTHPDWRRRGIGRAMTAAALRAARDSGARQACLDATRAGVSIYLRLGFEVASPTTRFSRAG
jgi:GNAT superfamily N-acetyltransferase